MRTRRRADAPRPDTVGEPVPGRGRFRRHLLADWDVYLVIAAGGAGGGLARWGVGAALHTAPGAIPWGTLLINVSGSFLLGALMVCVLDVWPSGRYVRPFWAVGVLGGYTTFSTYTVEARDLLAAGEPARAFSYTVGSLAAGLLAVSAGIVLVRVLAGHPIGRMVREEFRKPPREAPREEVTDEAVRPGMQADGVRR